MSLAFIDMQVTAVSCSFGFFGKFLHGPERDCIIGIPLENYTGRQSRTDLGKGIDVLYVEIKEDYPPALVVVSPAAGSELSENALIDVEVSTYDELGIDRLDYLMTSGEFAGGEVDAHRPEFTFAEVPATSTLSEISITLGSDPDAQTFVASTGTTEAAANATMSMRRFTGIPPHGNTV